MKKINSRLLAFAALVLVWFSACNGRPANESDLRNESPASMESERNSHDTATNDNEPPVSDERQGTETPAPIRLEFRNEEGNVLLSEENVSRANYIRQGDGFTVALRLDSIGTEIFAEVTKANIGRLIFIYVDDILVASPMVHVVITDGNVIISGGFSRGAARDLARRINEGSDAAAQASLDIFAETPESPPIPQRPSLLDLEVMSLGERITTNLAPGPDGRIAMVITDVAVGIDGTADSSELAAFMETFTARLSLARAVVIDQFGRTLFDDVETVEGRLALAEQMTLALQETFDTDLILWVFFTDWFAQRQRQ